MSKHNTQILWCGCFEDDEEFLEKTQKGYKLASAQISQKNIIYGIEKVSGIILDSINGSIVPHYPAYTDLYVKSNIWSHSSSSYDISVGYLNLKYLNRITCANSMIKSAKSWIIKRYNGGDLLVIAYSMRYASMATITYIKKHIPNAKFF